ncbi:MAG: hypothetical protein EA001_12725 [Oscillatoriales cyanobacterium]|nr:MAG: hypothetical protein EA001_12725 [Oscillatoriales cyanobacterium]
MDLNQGLTGKTHKAAVIGLIGPTTIAMTGQSISLVAAVGGGAIALAVLVWLLWRRSANRRSSSSPNGSSRSGNGWQQAIDALPLTPDQVGEVAEIVVNEAIEELAEAAGDQVRDWVEEKTTEPEPIAAESGNFETIFDAVEAAIESGGVIESDTSSDYASSDSGSDSGWSSSDYSSDSSSDYSSSSSDYSSSDSGWSSSDSSSDYSSSDSSSDSGWSSSD